MRQGTQQDSFEITHRLRMRTADAYAAALEAAGFARGGAVGVLSRHARRVAI